MRTLTPSRTKAVRVLRTFPTNINGVELLTIQTEFQSELILSDKVFIYAPSLIDIDNTNSNLLISNDDIRAFGYTIRSVSNDVIVLNYEWESAYAYDSARILQEDETIWISRTVVKSGKMYGGEFSGGIIGEINSNALTFNRDILSGLNPDTHDTILQYCIFSGGVFIDGIFRGAWMDNPLNTLKRPDNSIYPYGSSVFLSGDFQFGFFENGTAWNINWIDYTPNPIKNKWFNGYWKGGTFENGEFAGGIMTADWKRSTFQFGSIKGGDTRDVIFQNGEISGTGNFNSISNIKAKRVRVYQPSSWVCEVTLDYTNDDVFYFIQRLVIGNDSIQIWGLGKKLPIISKILDGNLKLNLTNSANTKRWIVDGINISGNDVILTCSTMDNTSDLVATDYTDVQNISPIIVTKSKIDKGVFRGDSSVWYQNIYGYELALNNVIASNGYVYPSPPEAPNTIFMDSGVRDKFMDSLNRGYVGVVRKDINQTLGGVIEVSSVIGDVVTLTSPTVIPNPVTTSDIVLSNIAWDGCTLVNGNWVVGSGIHVKMDVRGIISLDANVFNSIISILPSSSSACTFRNGYVRDLTVNGGQVLRGVFRSVQNNRGVIDNRLGDIHIGLLTLGESEREMGLWYTEPYMGGGLVEYGVNNHGIYSYGYVREWDWRNGYYTEPFDVYYEWDANVNVTEGFTRHLNYLSPVQPTDGPYIGISNFNEFTFIGVNGHRFQSGYKLFNHANNWDENVPNEHNTEVEVVAVTGISSIQVANTINYSNFTNNITSPPRTWSERTFRGNWHNGVMGYRIPKIEEAYPSLRNRLISRTTTIVFLDGIWKKGKMIQTTFNGLSNKLLKFVSGSSERSTFLSSYIMSGRHERVVGGFCSIFTSDNGKLELIDLNTGLPIGNILSGTLYPTSIIRGSNVSQFLDVTVRYDLISPTPPSILKRLTNIRNGSIFHIPNMFTESREEILEVSIVNDFIVLRVRNGFTPNVGRLVLRGDIKNPLIDLGDLYGEFTFTQSGNLITTSINVSGKTQQEKDAIVQSANSLWIERTLFVRVSNFNFTQDGFTLRLTIPDLNFERDVAKDTITTGGLSITANATHSVYQTLVRANRNHSVDISGNVIRRVDVEGANVSVRNNSENVIFRDCKVTINSNTGISRNLIINNTDITGGALTSSVISGRDKHGYYSLDRESNVRMSYPSVQTNPTHRVHAIRRGSLTNLNDITRAVVTLITDTSLSREDDFGTVSSFEAIKSGYRIGGYITLNGFNGTNSAFVGSNFPVTHFITNISTIGNAVEAASIGKKNNIFNFQYLTTSNSSTLQIEIISPFITAPNVGTPVAGKDTFWATFGNAVNVPESIHARSVTYASSITRIGSVDSDTSASGLRGIIAGGVYNTSGGQSNTHIAAYGINRNVLWLNGNFSVTKLSTPVIRVRTSHNTSFVNNTYIKILSNNGLLNGVWRVINITQDLSNQWTELDIEVSSAVFGSFSTSNTFVTRVIYSNGSTTRYDRSFMSIFNMNIHHGYIRSVTVNSCVLGEENPKRLGAYTRDCVFNGSGNIIRTAAVIGGLMRAGVYESSPGIFRAVWNQSSNDGGWFKRGVWLSSDSNSLLSNQPVGGSFGTPIISTNQYSSTASQFTSGVFGVLGNNTDTIWEGGTFRSNKKQNTPNYYSYGQLSFVEDAVIGLVPVIREDARSSWDGGTFNRGDFNGGIFRSGIFRRATYAIGDKSRFISGYFKGGVFETGDIDTNTSDTNMGPVVPLIDDSNLSRYYTIFGTFFNSAASSEFMGNRMRELSNPVSIKNANIINGYVINSIIDSVESNGRLRLYEYSKGPDGLVIPEQLKQINPGTGQYLNIMPNGMTHDTNVFQNLPPNYNGNDRDIAYESRGWFVFRVKKDRRNVIEIGTLDILSLPAPLNSVYSQGNFRFSEFALNDRLQITRVHRIKLNGSTPSSVITNPLTNQDGFSVTSEWNTGTSGFVIGSNKLTPVFKVINTNPNNGELTLDESMWYDELPGINLDNELFIAQFRKVNRAAPGFDLFTPTRIRSGEVVNSLIKASRVEPSQPSKQKLIIRKSIIHTAIVKDTGFGSNQRAFQLVDSIWYSGRWENGYALRSVFNSGYCSRWRRDYTNTDDLRTYFYDLPMQRRYGSVTPIFFDNRVNENLYNLNTNTYLNQVRYFPKSYGLGIFRINDIPTLQFNGITSAFPSLNPVGALNRNNVISNATEFAIAVSINGSQAIVDEDATNSTSLGLLYDDYNNKNALNLSRNLTDYTILGEDNRVIPSDFREWKLLKLSMNTLKSNLGQDIVDPSTKIKQTNCLFHMKRFAGSVDNFMTHWLNGTAVGCTWNGGVFSNGLFTSDIINNTIGLWTRGIWAGGFFGSGIEPNTLKPVFMSLNAQSEWNPISQIAGSNDNWITRVVIEPRNRIGYTEEFVRRHVETRLDNLTSIPTELRLNLPLNSVDSSNKGEFYHDAIASWFGRNTRSTRQSLTSNSHVVSTVPSVFNGVFINGIWENTAKIYASVQPIQVTPRLSFYPIDQMSWLGNMFPHFSRYAEWGNNLSYVDYLAGLSNPDRINVNLRSNIVYTLLPKTSQIIWDDRTVYLPLAQMNKAVNLYSPGIDDRLGNWTTGSFNFVIPDHLYGRHDFRNLLYCVRPISPTSAPMTNLTDPRIRPSITSEPNNAVSLDSILENNWRGAHKKHNKPDSSTPPSLIKAFDGPLFLQTRNNISLYDMENDDIRKEFSLQSINSSSPTPPYPPPFLVYSPVGN